VLGIGNRTGRLSVGCDVRGVLVLLAVVLLGCGDAAQDSPASASVESQLPTTATVLTPPVASDQGATPLTDPLVATNTTPPPPSIDERPTGSVYLNPPGAGALPGPPLEPGRVQLFELDTHCGVGFLSSSFNDQWWRTADAHDQRDWMPAEWTPPTSASGFVVELLLSADGETLTVTYNDHAVVYTPTELRTSDICA